jgi:hypothetical protein
VESINRYARSNTAQLRKSLSAVLRPTGHCCQNLWLSRGGLAADEILDPQARLEIHFQIVIGRRSMLSEEEQVRRASDRFIIGDQRPFATYDRFADVACQRDCVSRQDAAREDNGHASAWYHRPDEDPPRDIYHFGEIEGTKQELALCLGASKPNDRTLNQKARTGSVWVKRYHRTSFGVWFKTHDAYARANGIKISLSSNRTQTTESSRSRSQTTV